MLCLPFYRMKQIDEKELLHFVRLVCLTFRCSPAMRPQAQASCRA